MSRPLDAIEQEYERAIARAMSKADNDLAHELSMGLQQYRTLYQDRSPWGDDE